MSADQPCDVLIVGAGPAGCVLAARLSEDAGRAVTLLEAGPDYGSDAASWPPALLDPLAIAPDLHGWGYLHANRPADQPLALSRARVIGGTSTINACVWLRGSAIDYDGWAARGNPGWGFDHLLPHFRRSESDPLGGPLHGVDGPIPISRVTEADLTPLDRAFREAALALGFPEQTDLNGAPTQSPGVGPTPKNVGGGTRLNGALTYLAQVRGRPNLTIVPDALVDRLLVEGGRAAGVLAADGRTFRAREVVLCAGAFGSPAILLRSGIGPAEETRALGLPVVLNRPGVGRSLLDHPLVNGLLECDVRPGFEAEHGTFTPIAVKARSGQADGEIDLHVYNGQHRDAGGGATFWFSTSLQEAHSRGSVRLASSDPEAAPIIDHAWVSDPRDLEALCDGVELVNRLAATPPLARVLVPRLERSLRWRDRDELRAKVRARAGTTYHPSGTCRMGPATDPDAVVDHEGRVHGLAGLRVADASIFPTIPRANLHATIVAAAEKLADSIRRAITAK